MSSNIIGYKVETKHLSVVLVGHSRYEIASRAFDIFMEAGYYRGLCDDIIDPEIDRLRKEIVEHNDALMIMASLPDDFHPVVVARDTLKSLQTQLREVSNERSMFSDCLGKPSGRRDRCRYAFVEYRNNLGYEYEVFQPIDVEMVQTVVKESS